MKKQKTFDGKYCLDNALEYLKHLKECFEIRKAKLICYKSKRRYIWGGANLRCKLEVSYN